MTETPPPAAEPEPTEDPVPNKEEDFNEDLISDWVRIGKREIPEDKYHAIQYLQKKLKDIKAQILIENINNEEVIRKKEELQNEKEGKTEELERKQTEQDKVVTEQVSEKISQTVKLISDGRELAEEKLVIKENIMGERENMELEGLSTRNINGKKKKKAIFKEVDGSTQLEVDKLNIQKGKFSELSEEKSFKEQELVDTEKEIAEMKDLITKLKSARDALNVVMAKKPRPPPPKPQVKAEVAKKQESPERTRENSIERMKAEGKKRVQGQNVRPKQPARVADPEEDEDDFWYNANIDLGAANFSSESEGQKYNESAKPKRGGYAGYARGGKRGRK